MVSESTRRDTKSNKKILASSIVKLSALGRHRIERFVWKTQFNRELDGKLITYFKTVIPALNMISYYAIHIKLSVDST